MTHPLFSPAHPWTNLWSLPYYESPEWDSQTGQLQTKYVLIKCILINNSVEYYSFLSFEYTFSKTGLRAAQANRPTINVIPPSKR